MADSSSTITIVVGAMVTIIGGFGVIAKLMLAQASKDRDADRAERKELALAIQHMAENSQKVAEATERGAQEAKDRNGHLGEQTAIVAEIGRKNNVMTARILNRLEKSEETLKRNTKKVAAKVETVKTDLEDNNPIVVEVEK